MDQRHRSKMPLLVLLMVLCASTIALPSSPRSGRDGRATNIVGVASNILAADVLRAHADSGKNFVFSPLGFSSILAILAEGARGETAERIASALQHPADPVQVRAAYNAALGRLQGDSPLQAPQFKTWLYIYRNNTVLPEFQRTLRTDYHVEVKEIDRYDSIGWAANDDDDDLLADKAPSPAAFDNNEPTFDLPAVTTEAAAASATAAVADADNSKDIPEFDTLKVNNGDDETRLIDDQQDASKFDEVVEDKQYVEVPVILEEIAAQQQQQKKDTDEAAAVLSNTETVAEVKQSIFADNNQYVPESVVLIEGLKATKASIQESAAADQDGLEIMEAQASNRFNVGRSFAAQDAGEVASVISGNSIVGKKNGADETESKLILFNGLYYRGSWAAPFQQLRTEPAANVFYKSDTDKCTVHMMRARGQFRYAALRDAKAQAIELPYDNSRYALLIVVPNSRTGLRSLQSDFSTDSIRTAVAQLSAHSIDLSLPKFSVDTTGGIESILAAKRPAADLASIFDTTADFSGISADQALHVEELQQHVSVRIDEGASSENVFTATNALRSSASASPLEADDAEEVAVTGAATDALSMVVDRPFLFFVRDVVDDVLIVAGMVVEPTPASAEEGPAALLLD